MKKLSFFIAALTIIIVLNVNKTYAQWYLIPSLKYHNIYCSLSLGDSTVIVGGDNMTLLKSTDNGLSWTSIMQNGIMIDTVLSLGKGLGYIFAGANGVDDIYRSSDMGDSWSISNTGLPGSLLMNQFAFADTMLYVATNAGIYGSADSGKTWQADTMGLNIGLVIPELNNSTIGIVAAGSKLYTIKSTGGDVYFSSKDTLKWKIMPNNLRYINYAIAAVDTNVFIGNQQGIYLLESDSTWSIRDSGLPVNDTTYIANCMFTVSDSMLFAYIVSNSTHSFSKDVYVTSDLGKTWTKVNDSVSTENNITAMSSNKKYLFAGTQMGGWRIPISSLVTSVENYNHQIPPRYYLSQNFPNPFNPSTTIQYDIPKSGLVTIKVYDALGREVKTLVNQYQQSGKYNIKLDASNLPSGIYFYQLRTGNYTATKKLLLLK